MRGGPVEEPDGSLYGLLLGDTCPELGEHDVLDGGEVREEVEALEHHSDGLAEFGEVLAEHLVAREDLLARDLHVCPLGNLEQVPAPHQRRLAYLEDSNTFLEEITPRETG